VDVYKKEIFVSCSGFPSSLSFPTDLLPIFLVSLSHFIFPLYFYLVGQVKDIRASSMHARRQE